MHQVLANNWTKSAFRVIGWVLVVAGMIADLGACLFPFTTSLSYVDADGRVRIAVAATVTEAVFIAVMYFGLGLGVGFLRLAEEGEGN